MTDETIVPESVATAVATANEMFAARNQIKDAIEAQENELAREQERLQTAKNELADAQANFAMEKSTANRKALDRARKKYQDAADTIEGIELTIPRLKRKLADFDAEDFTSYQRQFSEHLDRAQTETLQPYLDEYRAAAARLDAARCRLIVVGRSLGGLSDVALENTEVRDPANNARLLTAVEPTRADETAARLARELAGITEASRRVRKQRDRIERAKSNWEYSYGLRDTPDSQDQPHRGPTVRTEPDGPQPSRNARTPRQVSAPTVTRVNDDGSGPQILTGDGAAARADGSGNVSQAPDAANVDRGF